MNEEEARRILGRDAIEPDNRLTGHEEWVEWPRYGETTIGLDGTFTADELEAMAWWMRNMKVGKKA